MLRALVLFSVLAASAGLQLAAVPMRSGVRASPLRMQEEPQTATGTGTADEAEAPAAAKAIGSDPFAFEGIGKVRGKNAQTRDTRATAADASFCSTPALCCSLRLPSTASSLHQSLWRASACRPRSPSRT